MAAKRDEANIVDFPCKMGNKELKLKKKITIISVRVRVYGIKSYFYCYHIQIIVQRCPCTLYSTKFKMLFSCPSVCFK